MQLRKKERCHGVRRYFRHKPTIHLNAKNLYKLFMSRHNKTWEEFTFGFVGEPNVVKPVENDKEMGSYKKTEEMIPRVEEPKPPNITHDILLFSTRCSPKPLHVTRITVKKIICEVVNSSKVKASII
ncbi:hypothetical protein Peur_033885 [Populus x canadensis]